MPKNKRQRKNQRKESQAIDDFVVSGSLPDPALKPQQPSSDFFVDTKGTTTPSPLSKQERKLKARNKPLQVQRGLVTLPDEKKRQTRKVNTVQKNYVEKIQNAQKKRKLNDGSSKATAENSAEMYDIWEAVDEDTRDKIVKEYPVIEKGYLENRKRKVKVPERDRHTELKSVEVAKAGASYNPSNMDHQMLLKEAVDEQVKNKQAFDKVMKDMRKNKREGTSLKEDTPYLPDSELVDEEPVSDDDTPMEHVNVAVVPRLTQAEINKKQRKKVHDAIVKKNLADRTKKDEDIMEIISEVEKEQQEAEQKRKSKNRKSNPTRRLGKERFHDQEVNVLLTEELPKSLKDIKPTTDLLEDRFHSLQKRNLIEVRSKKNYERRYPLKFKVKIRHREFENEQEKKYANL